jgi:hypothetical protein
MSRKSVVWALAAVAVAGVLVLVGRLERRHHANVQNARIAKVMASVGSLTSPTLDAYRMRAEFDCLIYKRGANPYALELCVDGRGRVLEAIDRRHGEPWIGSVREERSLASNTVSRQTVDRLLKKMHAQPVGVAPWQY